MNGPSGKPIGYADLANFPEDRRIRIIAACVVDQQQAVGVALENEPKKIARYRRKLEEARPGLIEFEQRPGLVPGTVLLNCKPKTQNVPDN